MNAQEFLWHAKRGHGECLLEMKKQDISIYKRAVKNVFLNNYAFLLNDEYRSSFACELIKFYNEDSRFLLSLWKKLLKTNLNDFYTIDYLLNNIYFILKRNKKIDYTNKLRKLLNKYLSHNYYSFKESNATCSLLSLIIDLKININVKELVNSHFQSFTETNLDLSSIEQYYGVSFIHKAKQSIPFDKTLLDNNELLLNKIKKEELSPKDFYYISLYIKEETINYLFNYLLANNSCGVIKTNILQIIFFSKKYNYKYMQSLFELLNNSNNEQKELLSQMILSINNKAVFVYSNHCKIDKSLLVRIYLKNYKPYLYKEIHKIIREIKIDYSDSKRWYEIEEELIKYCNKRKNVDVRLLNDLRHFLLNGLCSTSRYKIILILKRHNMIKEKEITALKYDANQKIRNAFR